MLYLNLSLSSVSLHSILKCLETFLVVAQHEEVLLASSGERTGMLLSVLNAQNSPSTTKNVSSVEDEKLRA